MKKIFLGFVIMVGGLSSPSWGAVDTVTGKVSPQFSGDLTLQPDRDLTVSGPTGFIISGGSIIASGFFGNGSALTGITAGGANRVLRAGDTMTGQLLMSGSSIALTGSLGTVTSQSSITASAFFGDGSALTGISAGLSTTTLAASTITWSAEQSYTRPLVVWNGIISSGTTQGGISIGNPRGAGAIDLQTGRSSLLQVAGGNFSVIGGGQGNTATSAGGFDTVSGGHANFATGGYASVIGGDGNAAAGPYSIVGGGNSNNATGTYNVISGGSLNTGAGTGSTIGGGASNTAGGNNDTVGGGVNNTATNPGVFDTAATVSGGDSNTATGGGSVVGGGRANASRGLRSTVPGGENNAATGDHSFAAGRQAKATAQGSFVWADSQGVDLIGTTTDQFLIRAAGGVSVQGNVTSNSSVTASGFFGNGAGLTNVTGVAVNLTGPVTSVGAATTIVGPVPASAVDLSTVTTALALKVAKAGDTMTGALVMAAATGNSVTYGLAVGSITTSAGSMLNVNGANTFANNSTFTSSVTLTNPSFSIGASTLAVTSGFVGLGTDTPATKLHIASGTLTIDGTGAAFNVAASTFVVLNTGFVGVGIAAPTSRLQLLQHLNSDVGGFKISNIGVNRNLLLWVDVSNISHIDSGSGGVGTLALNTNGVGKVGISTSTPQTTLDVNGNASFGSGGTKSTFTVAGALTMGGFFRPQIRTKAQFDAITPAVGDIYLCSDCTVPYDTCVGTGATVSGFRANVNSAINTITPGTLVAKGCGTGN